jgi:DNA-binding transcriptional regulator YdaS (Cro superfamily)
MEVNPLEKAAGIVGNANKLAKAINRSQSTVWLWMQRGWPAPDACRAIEEATEGKVTAAELLEPAMRKSGAA